MYCSLPKLLVALFGSLIKMHLRGVKQLPVQSEIGSVACSADVGGQQGVRNGLQKVLEGHGVQKAISKLRNIKANCTMGSGY